MDKYILVVDDEENIRKTLKDILQDYGYKVETVANSDSALKAIRDKMPDLVLLDVWIPGLDGIQLLKLVTDINPDIKIIMMSGHASIDTAVQSTRQGALDFIEKPFSIDKLINSVNVALHHDLNLTDPVKEEDDKTKDDIRLELKSDFSRKLQKKISSIAENLEHTLLLGEEGVGKETAAEYIFKNSSRSSGRFSKILCKSITEPDFYSKFDSLSADTFIKNHEGGVLFISDIERLTKIQQKVLAESLSSYFDKNRSSEAAVILASALSLSKRLLIPDLISFFKNRIRFRPLRNIREDIKTYIECFIKIHSHKEKKQPAKISPELISYLSSLDWKKNIGELHQKISYAVKNVSSDSFSLEDFGFSKDLRIDHGRALKSVRKGKFSLKQKTLKQPIVLCGQGLHSGINTGIILTPLPANAGIIFSNIATGAEIEATIENVRSTEYSTTISKGLFSVKTIEHIMSALSSYQISNVLIKIGDEAPIRDGSSLDFCSIIEQAGIKSEKEKIDPIELKDEIVIGKDPLNGPFLIAEPSDKLSIEYHLDYPQPIGKQSHYYEYISGRDYKENIAPARTFVFIRDYNALSEAGLASGGKLNNVVLIGEDKIINTPLRFPNEPARHKILDLIGDLYILRRPLLARIKAVKTGHTHNIALVKKISELIGATASI